MGSRETSWSRLERTILRSFALTLLCLLGLVSTQVDAQCGVPSTPQIDSTPSGVLATGQTYTLGWTSDGNENIYLVERSTSPAFDQPEDEEQYVSARAASFVAFAEGTYHHRVSAVAGCDSSKVSLPSATATVPTDAGSPIVVFSVHPKPVFVDIASDLAPVRESFAIENLGDAPVVVEVVREEGSFFTVTDPDGGDVRALSLVPGVPKRLGIRFDGASSSGRMAFEGLISVRGVSEALVSTVFARVSLLVSGSSTDAVPSFSVSGVRRETVAFPAYLSSDPDGLRPSITIEIVNPGSSPMDVAADIEPDVWVRARAGWNTEPIPAGGVREVELFADRSKVAPDAAFPRFTYFIVRTKEGRSARLLVEDRNVIASEPDTIEPDASNQRAFILPGVVGLPGPFGSRFATRLRITNVSNKQVDADLLFDSQFTGLGRKATVTVPPNDVVSFEDVVAQVFGGGGDEFGQLVISSDDDAVEVLTVSAATYRADADGRKAVYVYPVLLRGEGASLGRPHALAGAVGTSEVRSNLNLVETNRTPTTTDTTVRLTLFDRDGSFLGVKTLVLRPGEQKQVNNIAGEFGVNVDGGSFRISVTEGNGTVVVTLLQIDNVTSDLRESYVSEPVDMDAGSRLGAAVDLATASHVIVGAEHGQLPGSPFDIRTLLSLTAIDQDARVTISLLGGRSLATPILTKTVPAGETIEFADALGELFNLSPSVSTSGTILIQTLGEILAYGKLTTTNGSTGTISLGSLPAVSIVSEALVSAGGLQRPVYFDGAEQSTDPTVGNRWSLQLTELVGASATVSVRLYEAANRQAPIGQGDFTLGPFEHLTLDTVFSALDLDTEERRKDRYNVQVVVYPKSGQGRVAANASGKDVVTGRTTKYILTPNGGVPASGVSLVAPVLPPFESERRRPVRR